MQILPQRFAYLSSSYPLHTFTGYNRRDTAKESQSAKQWAETIAAVKTQ